MGSQKYPSLQSIIKHRRQEEFVGRQEQTILFQQNLTYDLEDSRRHFIFNIFGQGGVGKTSLLRRFSKFAEDALAISAWIDEADEDVPTVMAHITEQVRQHDHAFKAFNERYHVYRQRRQELEADPEAPQSSLDFLSHILTKVGVRLGRRIPLGGAVFDLVDENALASQISEWSAYVKRKLTDKDELHLVQEPIEVLTPLFLEGLRKVAEKHLVALFFDTYERTSEYLDDWLRKLLEGHYGDMPANVILSIAGRDELDKNRWVIYEGLLVRLPLEPFTDQEAREYLARKGIVDEHTVKVILHLSGCFPLLVATLASESPSDANQVGDPSGTAVERFLKWEADLKQRQMVLNAALPRVFNRDVLAILTGEENADALFTWLKQKPFVEQHTNGWVYHNTVRSQMLHYKLLTSPKDWSALHKQLAEYYEKLRDNLELGKEQILRNSAWQTVALEALYHRLCESPQKQVFFTLSTIKAAVELGFLVQDAQNIFISRLGSTAVQAGEDSEVLSNLDDGMRRFNEEASLIRGEIKKVDEQKRLFEEEKRQYFREMDSQFDDIPDVSLDNLADVLMKSAQRLVRLEKLREKEESLQEQEMQLREQAKRFLMKWMLLN